LQQYPHVAVQLMVAMIARYVIQPSVGDSGLWNILVKFKLEDGWVVPIDMEEVRGGCEMATQVLTNEESDPLQQLSHLLCARGMGPKSKMDKFRQAICSEPMRQRMQQMQRVVDEHRDWFSIARWTQIVDLLKRIQ
jgi:hypothetical protein